MSNFGTIDLKVIIRNYITASHFYTISSDQKLGLAICQYRPHLLNNQKRNTYAIGKHDWFRFFFSQNIVIKCYLSHKIDKKGSRNILFFTEKYLNKKCLHITYAVLQHWPFNLDNFLQKKNIFLDSFYAILCDQKLLISSLSISIISNMQWKSRKTVWYIFIKNSYSSKKVGNYAKRQHSFYILNILFYFNTNTSMEIVIYVYILKSNLVGWIQLKHQILTKFFMRNTRLNLYLFKKSRKVIKNVVNICIKAFLDVNQNTVLLLIDKKKICCYYMNTPFSLGLKKCNSN